MNREDEGGAVILIACLPTVLAALGYIGWWSAKADLSFCLVVAAASGLVAGAIHGRRSVWGVFLYPIPFVVGTTSFMFITAWYLASRTGFFWLELIIPGIIAYIPFGIVYLFIGWLITRLGGRKVGVVPFLKDWWLNLSSEGRKQLQIPQKYMELANHLGAGRWKEADEETTKLLMEQEQSSLYSAVWVNLPSEVTPHEIFSVPAQRISEYCRSIPCENLQIVDHLWTHFSAGRFGLHAQLKVAWENGIQDINDIEKLGDLLGWRENNYWIYYEDLTFDINAPMGHLPVDWFFLVDRASGFLAREHESGKREGHVMFATLVWSALQSRFGECHDN
jgi:hypothetical protein